jgi:predicted nucleotide-binding protein
VFEFGYFVGLLGRAKVAALIPAGEELDIPSDFQGLVYITATSIEDDTWRLQLAREMKAAGLDVDLNKAVG